MARPLTVEATGDPEQLHRHLVVFHSLWTVPSDDHAEAHRQSHQMMWRPGTVDHVHQDPSPEAEEHGFW